MGKGKIIKMGDAAEAAPVPPPQPAETDTPPPADTAAEPLPPLTPLSEFFGLPAEQATDEQITSIINRHVQWILDRHEVTASHNVIVLYQSMSISRSDANRVYRGLAKTDRSKPLLLVLSSTGGEVAPAYFIAKLCRQATDEAVKIAVPRQAKSAATLICCGADEIHMGGLSELGPIDPQFGPIPALALKYSIEHLAQLASQYPGAREMFSDYLGRALNIQALGYFERVAESAKQYAERLLSSRRKAETQEKVEAIAHRLVYTYKDHGFVIDSGEAGEIFGNEVVKSDSAEYRLANELFNALDFVEWLIENDYGRGFSYVGGRNAALVFQKSKSA